MLPSVVVAAALAALSPAVDAGSSWSRAAEAVAILPDGPPGSPTQIAFYFSIGATVVEDTLDLSTGAAISINGNVVDSQVFTITGYAAGDSECADLWCLGQPCLCQGDPIVCRCSPIVRGIITSAVLKPGDVIVGSIWAPEGAAPAVNTSDDTHTATFDDIPLTWNRSVEITDVDPGQNGFTIHTDVDFDVNYDGFLDLSTEVEVLINDVVTAGLSIGLNDQQFLLCEPGCVACWFFGSCAAGSASACQCRGTFALTFNDVPAAPGDVLTVRVVNGTGGLPPLPGYGGDNEQTMMLCPWDCGDGDGAVGLLDFLAMLGQWGQVGASCDLGLGADGVGVHEFLDILARWGPCVGP